jgi:hypothetical protein
VTTVNNMKYQCCFCGNEIVASPPDPVRLAVFTEDPLEKQELYCHQRCLQRAVHPSVPLIVSARE